MPNRWLPWLAMALILAAVVLFWRVGPAPATPPVIDLVVTLPAQPTVPWDRFFPTPSPTVTPRPTKTPTPAPTQMPACDQAAPGHRCVERRPTVVALPTSPPPWPGSALATPGAIYVVPTLPATPGA